MMSPDELRKRSLDLRYDDAVQVGDDLIKSIEADVRRCRALLAARPTQTPPAPLDTLLPLIGWLIYEATWAEVQRIPTAFDRAAVGADAAEIALDRIAALADAARGLPWPEYAPRALGAIRAQALAESKRDTEAGYDAAWTLHQEAREKAAEFRDSLGNLSARARFDLDLDEVELQLMLAETGTACRSAEVVLSRWPEDFAGESEERWIDRMFRELTQGVQVGERAIDTGRRIRDVHGFVERVDEHRLAVHTALQNPGIMTARAALLLLGLGPQMRAMGRRPDGFESWAGWERHVLGRFVKAYETIEEQAAGPLAIRDDLKRQTLHMRLNLSLLKPGHHLPSRLSFDPVLSMTTLDEEAREALTTVLAGPADRRGRARGIATAMMPAYLRSMIDGGYPAWRERWFRLDQYATEPGRRERMRAALLTARTR